MTRSMILALSLSLAAMGGAAAHAETSLGTSKLRTKGGTNALKYSIVNSNSMQAAREIAYSINANYLRNYLASGYRVSVPALLASETQVRPWKAGEAQILSAKTGATISKRLTDLIGKAQRLHGKAEISDAELRSVQGLQGIAQAFAANSALLAKYKVAVLLDQ